MNDQQREIAPCPFCGNDAHLVDDLVTFHAECGSCGSTGPVSSYSSGAIDCWNRRVALTQPQAQQAAAVPAGDYWATIAGLESSVGHLSALVDQQRDLLAEVEDIFGRDGHGGRLEDGESELIDCIRSNLEMIAAPAAPPSPVLPLSDEQIESLLVNWPKDGIAFIDFARAIEAAHGITEPGAGGEST